MLGKHWQCHKRTSSVLSAKMISTELMIFRLLQFLLFTYFYNPLLDSTWQKFCFYDFQFFCCPGSQVKFEKMHRVLSWRLKTLSSQRQGVPDEVSEEFQIHISIIYMLILHFEHFKILFLQR